MAERRTDARGTWRLRRASRIRRRRGGYTLVELMLTIGIIGTLATIAIPTLIRYQLRAKMVEAKTNIGAIRTCEESHFAEYNVYVSATPFIPVTVSTQRTQWALLPSDPHGFNSIGFEPDGAVYFQYAVASDGGSAYTIEARSDLDGDDAFSTWGYVNPVDGTSAGVPGPSGTCKATGAHGGKLNSIAPCDAQSGMSEY